MLFSNQQLNFNFDTVSSLLSTLYADTKSYGAALYAYKVNLLSSIPILLSNRLPMSLVPRESLRAILDSVYNSQKDASDRLTLAIPMQDLLSYYDAKLLREVSTIKQGLLLTLSIPLSSSQTAFNVYRAHLIPMPQLDTSDALQWVTEGPYLAISEDSMESTTLTEEQFHNCLGSSNYRICTQTMATQLAQSSCLATLYFHNTLTALTVCDTEKVMLPTPEQATNLGYGIWLIKSASDAFSLREYSLSDENVPQRREHPGCHVCIITLECGTQLIIKNIKIRPDLETCDQIQAQRIQVQLPRPLQHLLSALPDIPDLPYFDSKTDANIILMKKIKTELSTIPLHSDPQQLMKIAEPIAHEMKLLEPALTEKLNTYVPIKLSLMLTLFVFIGNLLLHTLVM